MRRGIASRAGALYLGLLAGGVGFMVLGSASGQSQSPESIVEMLRSGGYVLVMRHASASDEQQAGPSARGGGARGGGGPRGGGRGGAPGEPRLDAMGEAQATAVGYAFRALYVPIGDVLSSPALRATETVRYLGYDDRQTVQQELGPNGDAAWLRRKAGEAPAEGTNVLVITHAGNAGVFGNSAAGLADGETLVVRPNGGSPEVVGRLTVRDWAILAVEEDS